MPLLAPTAERALKQRVRPAWTRRHSLQLAPIRSTISRRGRSRAERTRRLLFRRAIVSSSTPPKPITIYVDADACPVKQEVYRVAERHALKGVTIKVFVVSNSPIAVPRDEMIERVVVAAGMDEADNWIAERAQRGDIVVTADVPLASRC